MQEVEASLTACVEQLRSDVDVDVEALRQTLTGEGDAILRGLDHADTRLRQHLDDLAALSARCIDVCKH